MVSNKSLRFGMLLSVLALFACSNQITEFSTADGQFIRAVRVAGGADGDFTASPQMSNSADSTAEAEQGTTVATSGSQVPPKDGVQPGSESNQDKIDSGLMGACLDKLKSPNTYALFKVVNVNGTNENNRVVFEDLATSEAGLILLRVNLKNVNNSSIKLLNPKSTYCVDMQVKNMNQFKFQIACEAKVGFVRLTNKNANKMSTEVSPVQCD